jgi:phosphatidylglycerophosphate synthase
MDAERENTPSFWERYRLLFNRRGEDWWSIVFAYPVARFFVVLIESLKWITPTGVTWVGFACKLSASAMIIQGSESAVWWIILLLQISQVFDSMDGTLARARKSFSHLGGFLDKVTDAISFYVLSMAIGLKAAQLSEDPAFVAYGCSAGAANLLICYMYWIVQAAAEKQMSSRSMSGLAEAPSWRLIFLEWLKGWLRIFRFGEADIYLWISVGALLGLYQELSYFLLITQGCGFIAMFSFRSYHMHKTKH